MRIGIDIDNVIANFDDVLLKAYLKQDKELRNTGIVNDKVYFRKGMFDWTTQEEHSIQMIEELKPNAIYADFFNKLLQVHKENETDE